MKIHYIDHKIKFFIIEDYYSENEYRDIYNEVISLYPYSSQNPFETGTGINRDGSPKKKNNGIFLDLFFDNQRQNSKILQYGRKIFTDQIIDQLAAVDPVYDLIRTSRSDNTLLSYYSDGDYYQSHRDSSSITASYYLLPEGAKFSGGEFSYVDYGIDIPIKNNIMIVSVSCYKHEVKKILKDPSSNTDLLRVCISQFIYHPDNANPNMVFSYRE